MMRHLWYHGTECDGKWEFPGCKDRELRLENLPVILGGAILYYIGLNGTTEVASNGRGDTKSLHNQGVAF